MKQMLSQSQLGSKLEFRHPNEEELAEINQFKPRGSDSYDSNEIFIVPIIASNNLLHSEKGVWDEEALETMVQSYPGKDFMLDHDWDNSQKTFGFIYDAELWHFPKLNEQSINRLLVDSPDPQIDKEIIQRDGYFQVVAYGVIESSHPVTSEIRFRRKSDVSIGGFFTGQWICPICNTSFDDTENCKHYPPMNGFWQQVLGLEDDEIAPYYIRSGKLESVELSLVFAGACKQAAVIGENMINVILM